MSLTGILFLVSLIALFFVALINAAKFLSSIWKSKFLGKNLGIVVVASVGFILLFQFIQENAKSIGITINCANSAAKCTENGN